MESILPQIIANIPLAVAAWFLKDVYVEHKALRADHEAMKLSHATKLENHEVRIGTLEEFHG